MKLYASLNLNALADTLINEITNKDVWSDPFSAPVVIFADGKMEQWFKLRWLKSRFFVCFDKLNNHAQNDGAKVQNDSRAPVLLNLKTTRLEGFLADSIILKGNQDFDAGKVSASEQFEILSVAVLRDFLIQKLSEKEGSSYYFEKLNSSEVNDYLLDEKHSKNGEVQLVLNHSRLYDFSTKIAALFLDYELTRPKPLELSLKSQRGKISFMTMFFLIRLFALMAKNIFHFRLL